MAFNAKLYKEALQRPTYIDEDSEGNEVTFVGELVPFNTVVEFLPLLQDLENAKESDIYDMIEPVVLSIKMPVEAAEYIKRLPVMGVLEVFADFFVCLKGMKKP